MPLLLLSFGRWILGTVISHVAIKFVFLALIVAIDYILIPVILQHFAKISGIDSFMEAIPSGAWYFINLFKLPEVCNMILSAYSAAFILRHLPFR
ncbi:DUF2523 family protein [Klebsiella oxytoca]|uniref:DUF2523 family protein n=1 Tax=Salmonella sp. CQ22WZ0326SAL TaxID=3417689 RepID=UPI000A268E84|nr:DUF2523 family protein [Klebsiella pneumoniae]EKW0786051.1 DUF2523 domain-containing protein [Klebsiella michiganensis]HBT3726610.1 DUF2523 domain-containing protein [Klebsiella pneumoniae]HCI3133194.1 DUF2523 domain-containing protein [Klebsiella pneumoniae]HEL3136552.1 DUF2523 domain-containing protein [Klebsiella pneumoniae]